MVRIFLVPELRPAVVPSAMGSSIEAAGFAKTLCGREMREGIEVVILRDTLLVVEDL